MVLAIVVLTIAARWHSLPTDGLGQDDGWVFAGASKGGLGDLLHVSTNHPGFSLFLMGWSRFVSDATRHAPLPVLVIGVVTPVLLYLGLRRLRVMWSAALVASVVLAMSTTHVQLSGRVKPYVVECFLVLVLGLVVQRLSRVRWRWWIAAGWVVGALAAATLSVFALVATAVAIVVLVVWTERGDRLWRVAALGVQAAVQLGYFLVVQRSYDASQLAEDWGGPYDGYIDLVANPLSLVREVARHLSRLGEAVVGGGTAIALAVVTVAVVGLAVNAWRSERAPIARFLLGLFLVAFVGALAQQIPFGPLDYAGGFRASVWLAPSIVVGLAFALDGVWRAATRLAPTAGTVVAAAMVLAAGVVVVASAGDPPPYVDSGARSAAVALEQAATPDAAVIMFPLGINPWAAEPGSAVDIVAEPESLIGFHVQPSDPGYWQLYYPPWNGSVEQLRRRVGDASRVVIYDGLVGFGDQQLPALEQKLRDLGFEQTSTESFGYAQVAVWDRDPSAG